MNNIRLTPSRCFRRVLIVTAILLFQTAILFYVSSQKKAFHIDEIYSYIISNSSRADQISHADDLWGEWIDGQELNSFVSVQDGNQFSYKTAYLNTSKDCHPPLYYWMLHTVCSLFPGQFSKWFGLSLNIALFVLTGLGIFLLSEELFSTPGMRYMPLLMYGLSLYAFDTVTFIRMYMLLTLFAVLFVFFCVRMLKYGVTWKRMLAAWITIFLGAITQYYGIVFCFWGVMLFELILLKRRDYKHFLQFGAGSLASVVLMLVSFPYAIEQATGSPTNNIGNEVTRNLLNFGLWKDMTISLSKAFINKLCFSSKLSHLLFIAAMVLLVYCILCAAVKQRRIPQDAEALWLLCTTVLTFLSISFIGGEYVYLRYIYFIIPFFFILFLFAVDWLLSNNGTLRNTAVVLLILFSVGNGSLAAMRDCSGYLFQEQSFDIATISEYREYPCVMSSGSNRSTAIPTGDLIALSGFSTLYMDTEADIITSDVISTCLQDHGSCIVFAPNSPYWIKSLETDDFFRQALPQGYFPTYICDGCLGQYYLVSTQP